MTSFNGLNFYFFSRISHYSTASTFNAVYIIGGHYTMHTVAEYDNDQWRRLPDLRQGRRGHGSIAIGNRVVVIGGKSTGAP